MLLDGNFSNCFLLLLSQTEDVLNFTNKHRYDEGAPHGIQDGDCSSEGGYCGDISIPDSSHSDDDTPDRSHVVIEHKLQVVIEVHSIDISKNSDKWITFQRF